MAWIGKFTNLNPNKEVHHLYLESPLYLVVNSLAAAAKSFLKPPLRLCRGLRPAVCWGLRPVCVSRPEASWCRQASVLYCDFSWGGQLLLASYSSGFRATLARTARSRAAPETHLPRQVAGYWTNLCTPATFARPRNPGRTFAPLYWCNIRASGTQGFLYRLSLRRSWL